MAKSLGIFVSSPQNWRHIVGVTKAAGAKGSKVKIFLTWKGVHVTKCSEFPSICEIADVKICAVSYEQLGYDPKDIPKGLTDKAMSTQAEHGDIIDNYDCYLAF